MYPKHSMYIFWTADLVKKALQNDPNEISAKIVALGD